MPSDLPGGDAVHEVVAACTDPPATHIWDRHGHCVSCPAVEDWPAPSSDLPCPHLADEIDPQEAPDAAH